jgi:hypothetical protein
VSVEHKNEATNRVEFVGNEAESCMKRPLQTDSLFEDRAHSSTLYPCICRPQLTCIHTQAVMCTVVTFSHRTALGGGNADTDMVS